MKCLKTGLRFANGEMEYASDMYVDGDDITIIANRVGYLKAEGTSDNEVEQLVVTLAPHVYRAKMKFGPEYRAFHARWNPEVPVELLDKPILIVFR